MDDRPPAFEWPLARGETLSENDWVPFYRKRWQNSHFVLHALAEGRREDLGTAMLLWMAAYDQDPAGTLPDDDVVLAHLAGFRGEMGKWQEARPRVLRGWHVVAVRDAEEGEVFLGHLFIRDIVAQMHKRKRGRVAAREAQSRSLQRTRVRAKLVEMGRPRVAENGHVVDGLVDWLGEHNLYIKPENITAGLEAMSLVEIGRKGPRGPGEEG